MTDISYRGQATKDFEKMLSDYIGSYVACTNTGTSALHLALVLSELNNCKIIVPSITYVATANAITYVNSEPVFCDVKDDLNIDVYKLNVWLEKNYTKDIKGIMPVHVLGNPCDMDGVKWLAKKYELKIIEDSCQALGSWYNKKHCGTIANFGAISFNGNKIITTGGGGALICKTKKNYEKALHLSTVAKVLGRKQCYHDSIGFNYRMPASNAQIGIEGFKSKERFLNHLKELSKKQDVVNNGWKHINKGGSMIWQPIHTLPMYQDCIKTDCSNAERIGREVKIL